MRLHDPLKFFIFITIALTLTALLVPVALEAQLAKSIETGLLVEVAPPWDTIDQGVAECVLDALKYAESSGYALILRVNSYGGYLDSAFAIGDAIYDSRVPVLAFIEGKALSAATLIVLSADVVGVKRGSILGAMKPVIVNPVTGEVQFVNESKIIEPVVKKAVVYAERSGRNTSLVMEMVYQAKTVDSTEAVRLGLADYETNTLEELLERLSGKVIKRGDVMYELKIKRLEAYSCSLRSRFLSALSNAYLANLLLSIGVLTFIFALVSGRFVVLPIAIALILLGLISTGVSPNTISLLFIVLGAALLAVELFVIPGFGFVGISGIILLLLGFALLPMYIPTGVAPTEEYVAALRAFLIGVSVALGGFFGLVMFKVIEIKRKKPISYTPEGKVGVALDEIKPGSIGYVKVEGEYWRATSTEEIKPSEGVVVVKIREDGVLVVKKKS
jgi:membrane-bound serine protease (ClpP class)